MNFSRHFNKTSVINIGCKSLWISVGGRTLGRSNIGVFP